jgi:PAS domain S-box-containing protein
MRNTILWLMTQSESASRTRAAVAVFFGPDVRDHRSELRAGLSDLPLDVGAVGPQSELASASPNQQPLVISDTEPTVSLPAGTVWVTSDASVAAAVADEATVINWGFDDWEMLAARLDAELAAGTTAGDDPSRVLDRIEDAVFGLDHDHRVTHLNDAAADLLDVSSGAVEGELVWTHVPDDVATELRPAVETALADDEAVTEAVELEAGITLFEATVSPGPAGVTVHTSQQESDADPSLYEYLVETVGDAVYILDEEGHFVFVNDALCEMTGYERTELLGSSVHFIKDDETVAEAEDALRELLKSRAGPVETAGIDIAKLDVELVRKDGQRVPCTDRMTLRPLDDGEFTGTVGTLRDVSRQHRRQELLNGLVERSREMMTVTDTRAVSELVVSTAVDVFGLDLAVLRRYDADEDALVPVVTSTGAEEVLGERPRYGPTEGPVGTAFTEGELVVEEALSDQSGSDVTAVDSGAYLPIGDQYVLSLGHSSDRGLDDVTRGLLEVLGETATAAIDRVTREEHLRQYEAIVEAAEEALFTADDDGRFTLVTRPFARLLGYEREELVGRRLDAFLETDAIEEPLASDGPVVIETDLTSDGERTPARLTLSPFADGVVGTARDISQLQSARAEASRQRRRFVELFETLSEPAADVRYGDDTATVESVNPAFASLCDCDTETLRGRTFDTAQDAMPDALATALDPARSPNPDIETSVDVRTVNGERHYLIRTAPYEDNNTDRAFVLLTDVTEVKRRGTHLKVLHRLLRHNLRNRTSLIRGHAEQLEQHDLPAGAQENIEQILSASDALVDASETSRSVQRVLGFDSDIIEQVPADEALDRFRTDIAGSIDSSDTDITVSGTTDNSLPFSEYLVLALRELVENAVEHDPASEVEVVASEADAGVEISVSDDGTGIPEHQWDLLTGDQEITQLQHGDGLGLWLVKWTTDRHGGRLRLDNANEDGTRVTLVFPTDE